MSTSKLINNIISTLEKDQNVKIWDAQNSFLDKTNAKIHQFIADYREEVLREFGADLIIKLANAEIK